MTKAHSAAVACQCSSRIAPGSMLHRDAGDALGDWQLEYGRLFAVVASHHASFGLFQLELEGRQLLFGGDGIGHVVLEADVAAFGTDRKVG